MFSGLYMPLGAQEEEDLRNKVNSISNEVLAHALQNVQLSQPMIYTRRNIAARATTRVSTLPPMPEQNNFNDLVVFSVGIIDTNIPLFCELNLVTNDVTFIGDEHDVIFGTLYNALARHERVVATGHWAIRDTGKIVIEPA